MDDIDAYTGSHGMDEIALVRAVLASPPPPRPQVTVLARQRLAERTGERRIPAQPTMM